jgi:16S rRNA (cytidine1402-2'-O)-methyltransferase
MSARGTLYLVPVPLSAAADLQTSIPGNVVTVVKGLRHFVAENAKTARASLKQLEHPGPLRELHIEELNEHTPGNRVGDLLTPLLEGFDLGLMSEAGCPAVADPGSALVELAHRNGVRVAPLVGPSSLLLALMASGLNGQRFAFHGYLPAKETERQQALQKLEADSRKTGGVEIFIETPYRNQAMVEALLRLSPSTRLCVACDLTLPSESIRSARIADWRKAGPSEDYSRRPAVFLLQA